MEIFKKLLVIGEMIKFEHTVFALPFALGAALVAADGFPDWSTLGWILLAMVGARSAAMGFNRLVDEKFDAQNPRTQSRALPRGLVSRMEAWAFVVISAAVFVWAASMLNTLALLLSPLALVIILGYSFTKRFTSFSHVVLGLALGIAPVGAWIAVRGTIDLPPIALAAAVMLWTAGFDIIYALQDVEFDKRMGLFSLPRKVGAARALALSRLMHAAMVALLVIFGTLAGLGLIYYLGVALVAAFLVYEHSLVKPDDFSKVNMAFFTLNGCVSVALFVFITLDVLIK